MCRKSRAKKTPKTHQLSWLFSAKRLAYEDWKQAYVGICHGERVPEEGKTCIWRLKQTMNKQRLVFCWKLLEVCS